MHNSLWESLHSNFPNYEFTLNLHLWKQKTPKTSVVSFFFFSSPMYYHSEFLIFIMRAKLYAWNAPFNIMVLQLNIYLNYVYGNNN